MVDSVGSISPAAIVVPPAATVPVTPPAKAAPTEKTAAPPPPVVAKASDLSLSVTLNTATHITDVKIIDTLTGQLLLQIPDAASTPVYPTPKSSSVAGTFQDITG